jgi:hypothetical protein
VYIDEEKRVKPPSGNLFPKNRKFHPRLVVIFAFLENVGLSRDTLFGVVGLGFKPCPKIVYPLKYPLSVIERQEYFGTGARYIGENPIT